MTSSFERESSRHNWPQSLSEAQLFIVTSVPVPMLDDLGAWADRYLFAARVYAHIADYCDDPIENARAYRLSYTALEQHLVLERTIDEQRARERRDGENGSISS